MAKTTMQDIADYLNISKNSVSQALRDKDGVSEQTKKQVIAAAEKLGYDYSPATTVSRKKNRFALFATAYTLSLQSFFGVILDGLRKRVEASDASLSIYSVTPEMQAENTLPDEFTTQNWTGIFILSFISDEYVRLLSQSSYPIVMIDHHNPSYDMDCVLSENIDGTEIAMDYLARNGYHTIGFLGDLAFSPSYAERYVGFQNSITKSPQLKTKSEFVINQIPENQPEELFQRLNELTELPDAWFTVNNEYAFRVLTYLQGRGIKIPQEAGLISFDDTDIPTVSRPQITVIASDLVYMGKEAWQMMQDRLSDSEASYRYLRVVPKIIERQTTIDRNQISH